jgi:polysaccharide biosynthesis/export protein
VRRTVLSAMMAAVGLAVAECGDAPELPSAPLASSLPSAEYRIGPGEGLDLFVWRNPELTVTVPVRPDGRVSIPFVEDVLAIGKLEPEDARTKRDSLPKELAWLLQLE